MKLVNRCFFMVILAALFAGIIDSPLRAEEVVVDNGGCGYTECCRSTSLAPAIALGTILVVAVVAVAVQNTSGHSHCHGHH